LASVAVGFVAAVFLTHGFAWFSGGMGIGLTLVAFGWGLLWHSRAVAGVPLLASVAAPGVSKPVAALGFAFIGFFWGGLFSMWAASPMVGALVLGVAPFALGTFRAIYLKRPLPVGYLLFAACSLLVGFAALLALQVAHA
jgi:hypothetical protein